MQQSGPGIRLIAEIGGSSSRWALLLPDGTERIHPNGDGPLPGFNPLTGDQVLFLDGLREHFSAADPEIFQAKELIAYGAGCGDQRRQERMREALAELWPQALIKVDSDIMAAAEGLCQGAHGLVLIAGTGMNAGYFDGRHLHQPMPSLGFILGDEGSGADMGVMLLQDAFHRRMPEEVRLALFGPEGPDLAATLDEVYRSPFPAKALAAIVVRLVPLLEHAYVRETITGRFHTMAELLSRYFDVEQRREVFATGSVAYGFRELLGECLLDHGMSLTKVEKDPLQGLILNARRQ